MSQGLNTIIEISLLTLYILDLCLGQATTGVGLALEVSEIDLYIYIVARLSSLEVQQNTIHNEIWFSASADHTIQQRMYETTQK